MSNSKEKNVVRKITVPKSEGACPKGADFAPPSPVRSEGRLQYWRPEDLTIVGLDTEANPEDPLFDERNYIPLNPRKVENVFLFGVQGTIKIEMRDGRPVIQNGRTSTRWARVANEMRVAQGMEPEVMECIECPPTDRDSTESVRAAATTVAVTNVHENDDPMTEARKMARYMGPPFNFSKADVAAMFSCNEETVNNRLKLRGLTPPVQDLVVKGPLNGGIGPTAAAKLATLSPEDQVDGAEALIEVGRVNDVNIARRVVKAILKAKAAGKDKPERKAKASKAARKASNKPGKRYIDNVVFAAAGKLPTSVDVFLKWVAGTVTKEEMEAAKWLADAVAKVDEINAAKAAKRNKVKTKMASKRGPARTGRKGKAEAASAA